MEKLRKEKEIEKSKEFQAHQELMRDNLQKHMECVVSDEDQRIAQAAQNQREKRDVSSQS